jgi:GC-rich sequence DNA-binding factor
LEQYKWHISLSSFIHSSEGNDEMAEPPSSQDEEIMSSMLAAIIIPKFEKWLSEVYDMFSLHQTKAALRLLDEVEIAVPKGTTGYESLITSLLRRVSETISSSQSLIFPYLSSLASPSHLLTPESMAARNSFLNKYYKLVQDGLRWKSKAKGIRLPTDWEGVGRGLGLEEMIKGELVDRTLVPVLEAAWETGGKEVGVKVNWPSFIFSEFLDLYSLDNRFRGYWVKTLQCV